MSDLVRNPEDKFFRDAAHLSLLSLKVTAPIPTFGKTCNRLMHQSFVPPSPLGSEIHLFVYIEA